MKNEIQQSDIILTSAIEALSKSERGRRVLVDFKALVNNGGAGLDSGSWRALKVLLEETANGRRDFLDDQIS